MQPFIYKLKVILFTSIFEKGAAFFIDRASSRLFLYSVAGWGATLNA
jgi:hypothetical protein